jgi:glucosyl-3-phosphoglycerate phosphatase
MILLRHGQSEFNLHFTATRRDPGINDPKLTELGHRQAEAAAASLAREPISRILCSPYTRALQTAAPIAKRLGLPVTVTTSVRERYHFACDVGSACADLRIAWPDHDFSAIDEIWWPGNTEQDHEVEARAAEFRAEMAALPDWRETLVVSHWGFILAMTGQRADNGQWLRCDPTEPGPTGIVWRAPHVSTAAKP